MWATATVAMISAIKYKKQRTVMTDLGGSRSPVTVYLKSTVMRRNVFDRKATDKSSKLIQRELVMHCMSSYSSVCSVPNNSLDSCFPSPVSVAEQEVDGSSRRHLSFPQPHRYKSLSLNEGSVADMKLFQSVSLQGGPCRCQITT